MIKISSKKESIIAGKLEKFIFKKGKDKYEYSKDDGNSFEPSSGYFNELVQRFYSESDSDLKR